jgi:hypothetical protein
MKGHRKLLLTLFCLITGLVLCFAKNDVPPNFLQLMLWICGAHHVANMGEHITEVFKK